MIRISRLLLAGLTAAFMAFSFAPAQAAGIPAGSALSIDQSTRADVAQVQYRHRVYRGRPVYRHRVYYGRPVYRPRPVYRGRPVFVGGPVYVGRRCVNRPRWVWTPYGHVRRWVRVCRW